MEQLIRKSLFEKSGRRRLEGVWHSWRESCTSVTLEGSSEPLEDSLEPLEDSLESLEGSSEPLEDVPSFLTVSWHWLAPPLSVASVHRAMLYSRPSEPVCYGAWEDSTLVPLSPRSACVASVHRTSSRYRPLFFPAMVSARTWEDLVYAVSDQPLVSIHKLPVTRDLTSAT